MLELLKFFIQRIKIMIDKKLVVEFSNGEVYEIPVDVIAKNRAEYYYKSTNEFSSIEESLQNDTIPLFEDDYEITDWASNNMNWSDVSEYAVKVKTKSISYDEEWCNSIKNILDIR